MICDYILFITRLSSFLVQTVRASCNADNCLRALSGSPISASAFCHTDTIAPAPSIPAFASACSSSASRLSSACSCFAGLSTSTVTTSPSHSSKPSTSPASSRSTTSPTSAGPTTCKVCPSASSCPPISTITLSASTCSAVATVTVSSVSTISEPGQAIPITSVSIITITASASTIIVTPAAVSVTDDITLPASTITDIKPFDIETLITLTSNIVSTAIAIITVIPTSTATCNTSPGGPQPTFSLLMIGGPVAGKHGILDTTYTSIWYTCDATEASLFTFNDACNLVSIDTGGVGMFPAGATDEVFLFATLGEYQGASVPAVCNLVEGLLQCDDQSANIFEYCTSYPVG